MRNEIINRSESYVKKILSEKGKIVFKYHNFNHIQKVVDAALEISDFEKVNIEEKEIIIIACLFHDLGYVDLCDGHEARSCQYARMLLEAEQYPEEKIQKIESCIMATKIPQQPKDKIEMIVCDADLHHLGTEDFFEVGNNLREEIEFIQNIKFTDITWLEKTIGFNKSHSYFTDYAKKIYGVGKKKNILFLENLLEQKLNEQKYLTQSSHR